MARPTIYCPEVVETICELISVGLSISEICDSDEKMPSSRTFWRWTDEKKEVLAQYVRAKRAQADNLISEIRKEISETTEENFRSSNVRIAGKQWLAERLGKQASRRTLWRD